jgi:hypothetical protein
VEFNFGKLAVHESHHGVNSVETLRVGIEHVVRHAVQHLGAHPEWRLYCEGVEYCLATAGRAGPSMPPWTARRGLLGCSVRWQFL